MKSTDPRVRAAKIVGGIVVLAIVAVVLLAPPAVIGAEDQSEGGPALTGQQIVSRAWRAMFGDRGDGDIRSLSVDAYFHGRTVPSRITLKRPDLFRNEVAAGVLVFDGARAAWVRRGPDDAGNPRGPELIEPEYWRHFEVDIALLFPAFFDHPSELRGIAKVNASDAYELEVHLPLGGIVTYFVDAESFLVTRRLVRWDGEADEAPWENLMDGWLDVDGIRFPDGYVFEGRKGREKGYYKNVRFNVEPADELFQLPAELGEAPPPTSAPGP